jgi:hypothetical protein
VIEGKAKPILRLRRDPLDAELPATTTVADATEDPADEPGEAPASNAA